MFSPLELALAYIWSRWNYSSSRRGRRSVKPGSLGCGAVAVAFGLALPGTVPQPGAGVNAGFRGLGGAVGNTWGAMDRRCLSKKNSFFPGWTANLALSSGVPKPGGAGFGGFGAGSDDVLLGVDG